MANRFPEGLEPALLWRHFARICSIPHGSGSEAALREAIDAWARDRGLQTATDAVGNLVVRVPASPGHEDRPATVLQGHLDMVNEKNELVAFDFATQGIDVRLDGEHLTAEGTTLGADNGIGVAAALAVAEDPDAAHGPLELLLTVDEETGLTGAAGLGPELVTGDRMINLDTEEEGAIYVGCAGGGDVTCRLPLETEPRPGGLTACRIEVKGGQGGHSGLDIHLERANAIRGLARMLDAVGREGLGYQPTRIAGGSMRNAIPREAGAGGCLPPDRVGALKEVVGRVAAELSAQHAASDPELSVTVEERPGCGCERVFAPAFARRVVGVLLASPSSVLAMSRDVPGLVETSSNLGVVRTTDEAVEVVHCARSSVATALEAARRSIAALFELAGAEVELEPGYPGWQPDLGSELLAVAQRVHEECFGRPAEVKAVHAGLECGLIGEKRPGLEMISIGPTITGAHSPDERVSVPATERFYGYLRALLAAL